MLNGSPIHFELLHIYPAQILQTIKCTVCYHDDEVLTRKSLLLIVRIMLCKQRRGETNKERKEE